MDKRVLEAMVAVRSSAKAAAANKCEAPLQSATAVLCQSLYASGVKDALPMAERFAEAQRQAATETFAIIKAVEG